MSVADLTLVRGWRTLVAGLTFDVAPGAGLALRGPNGSGKTTLLRALAGLHEPRAGTVRISGGRAADDLGQHVGFVSHLDAIKPGQPVAAQLGFWAALAGSAAAMPETLDLVGLRRQADLPGGVLSAGQRRRFALARLLLLDRPVWLLDEPAAPLDSAGRDILGGLLDRHRARGGIVITAVHDRPPGGAMDTLDLAAVTQASRETAP
ncbi:MAG: heme ABC exporter ATP-binding protein CcmA [Hyphomonadaceae bacterium]|nr:heme ABC exporter ATP-binding protein CcmA [Hyphomonadaceae bacterium]